ncbi:MAG: threonylcarbamoyl-AMP synthase [Verrucomicrobia bacterium]|nr:threonylcarbamoyl-AMP synthase [Verrucomicrobiota bacterium]
MRPDDGPTESLPTHTPALFAAALERAAEILRAGELAALPTETVYGLAANALDARAVARIFAAKGRPAHNPIIVHVSDTAMARRCAAQWPDAAEQLAAAFWPGPLTLVVLRTEEIPDAVTAGGGTVGIRWPGHPFIQAVIRACGFPLAAPSANLSNEISPTNAEHVQKSLGGKIPLIVDGGQSQVGIESTVVDVTRRPARVLRPGMIHLESLVAVLGEDEVFDGNPSDFTTGSSSEPLRSPGLLLRHYAPKARLIVFGWDNDRELDAKLANSPFPREQTHVIAHTRIPSAGGFGRVSVIPHDAEAFARALYAELHRCDEEGAQLIVAEAVPDAAEWRAVADRLARAAA